MQLLWVLLFGLVVSIVAELFTRDPSDLLTTAAVGVAGSCVASVFGQLTGIYQPGEVPAFFASVSGAVLFLFIHRSVDRQFL